MARALKEGEARPNTTPIPELSEAPRVDPQEALADLQARGGIEEDSPAMRALEDELRLVEEQALSDGAARQDAVDAMKDAYGYDELTFEEKKALGMTEGWEGRLDPETQAVLDEVDQAADALRQSTADGARLAQRMRETEMGVYDVVDPAERGADKVVPTGKLRKPVKPEPLRLSEPASQPDFTLPEALGKAAPRYGRFTVAFDSDLDRAAYILQNDLKKPSKAAPAFREAVEAAGLNPAAVAAHGARVKATLKEVAKGKDKGELRVPRQPFGDSGEVASVARRRPGAGSFVDISSFTDAPEYRATLSKFVRLVGGPDATVKFKKGYVGDIVPPEWGGDGIERGIIEGSYDYINDIVKINGLLREPLDNLTETAIHESFHRLQFMALTRKELQVLDSAEARARVMMVARNEGMEDISYVEAQTVAFQKYAIAKISGKDPVAEIFKKGLNYDHPLTPILAKIVSIFDKVAGYVERVKNLARGQGFNSIQSIFEKAQKGEIARRPRDGAGALQNQDLGFIRHRTGEGPYGTWVDRDTVRRPLDAEDKIAAIDNQIAAIDNQIAETKKRITEEGC